MDLEFDGVPVRGLYRYVALVAEALELTGHGWLVQLEPPVGVYLALEHHLTEFPGRDAALLWDERYGWSLAVESAESGELRTVAYLGGDVLPAPRAVAQFATDATPVADQPAQLRPVDADDDLPERLAGYARPGMPEDGLLTVLAHRAPDAVVLRVSGEVDHQSAPHLRESIDHALRERPALLVVDLTGVRFFGAPGMNVLVRAHQRAGESTQIRVVATGRTTMRPLQMTGLDLTMAIYPTLLKALGASPAGDQPRTAS